MSLNEIIRLDFTDMMDRWEDFSLSNISKLTGIPVVTLQQWISKRITLSEHTLYQIEDVMLRYKEYKNEL